jgi:hypothetical protein
LLGGCNDGFDPGQLTNSPYKGGLFYDASAEHSCIICGLQLAMRCQKLVWLFLGLLQKKNCEVKTISLSKRHYKLFEQVDTWTVAVNFIPLHKRSCFTSALKGDMFLKSSFDFYKIEL